MRFFGPPWSAPATEGATFEPAPVGEPCSYWDCRKTIGPDDQGVFLPWANPEPGQRDVVLHRACLLAEILGPDHPEGHQHIGIEPDQRA